MKARMIIPLSKSNITTVVAEVQKVLQIISCKIPKFEYSSHNC